VGIYGTEPRQGSGPSSDSFPLPEGTDVEETGSFARADPRRGVGALPQCSPDADAAGEVTVETYSVSYERGGAPERAVVACRTPDGRRAWANVTDADQLAMLVTEEGCGRLGTLRADGEVDLR
jgi:acetyl-CoA C-acetyltransferase